MRKFSEKFCSKYLRASDIQGDKTVVIARITKEEVGRDREEKVVLYFRNMSRGLILNQTNGARLAGSLGDDMDSWVGHTVTRTTEWTSFRSEGFRNFVSPTPANPKPAQQLSYDYGPSVPGSGQYLSPDA